MLFHLLFHQIFLGDVELFFPGIAGQLNDVHPVQQRRGDGGQVVGGGDEQHLAQIKGQFDVVVPEGVVLLPVQHFQHGGGRVPPKVVGHFVDFVQQDQGVGSPWPGSGR